MKLFLTLCIIVTIAYTKAHHASHVWCCTSTAEYNKCTAFASRFDANGQRIFDFECLLADGTASCMQHIKSGRADLIDIDGGDIFMYQDDITVVAAENVGYEDASYFAIAVVKKGADPGITMGSLAGYKTCHTGVGKTSGWNMPIGWLTLNGYDANDIGSSCAPGANSDKYATLLPGGRNSKWCELCIGDSNGENVCSRSSRERYYGYHGAFQCMKDGVGDVAFIKQTIIEPEEAHLYELLCPDGSRRASPTEWANCNLGKVPAHAVVMKKGVSAHSAEAVYNKLTSAWNQLGDRHSYNTGKNILWGSKVRFFMYMNRMSPRQYMGDSYFCATYSLRHGTKHSSC